MFLTLLAVINSWTTNIFLASQTVAELYQVEVHHDLDVVTSMTFSNVARTPLAEEHRSQSAVMFRKSVDMLHPGCRISSIQSVISTLPKSLQPLDVGSSPAKSTSSAGSNMSIRGPSAVVRGGRLESPLYHSMLFATSPSSTCCLDVSAAAKLPCGIMALVLETPAATFGKKYIGQDETTAVVTCEPCGGKLSTAVAGRSTQKQHNNTVN